MRGRNLGGKFGEDLKQHHGVEMMFDLYRFTKEQLRMFYGSKTGSWLYAICRGYDFEPVSARQLAKSIGCSKNFFGKNSLDTKEKVKHWLLQLATEVEERLVKDKESNKRTATSMVVGVRYENPIKGTTQSSSRTTAVVQYNAAKFTADAFSLLQQFNQCPSHQPTWSPPVISLSMSVGKFVDIGSTQTGGIAAFIKKQMNSSATVTNLTQESYASQSYSEKKAKKKNSIEHLFSQQILQSPSQKPLDESLPSTTQSNGEISCIKPEAEYSTTQHSIGQSGKGGDVTESKIQSFFAMKQKQKIQNYTNHSTAIVDSPVDNQKLLSSRIKQQTSVLDSSAVSHVQTDSNVTESEDFENNPKADSCNAGISTPILIINDSEYEGVSNDSNDSNIIENEDFETNCNADSSHAGTSTSRLIINVSESEGVSNDSNGSNIIENEDFETNCNADSSHAGTSTSRLIINVSESEVVSNDSNSSNIPLTYRNGLETSVSSYALLTSSSHSPENSVDSHVSESRGKLGKDLQHQELDCSSNASSKKLTSKTGLREFFESMRSHVKTDRDELDYIDCQECHEKVLVWDMEEHRDFHFAQQLQKSVNEQMRLENISNRTTMSTDNFKKKRKRESLKTKQKKHKRDHHTKPLEVFFKKL